MIHNIAFAVRACSQPFGIVLTVLWVWRLERVSDNVEIAMHYVLNVVWHTAGPFTWSGGVDRMGHCQSRPTRWSGSALREKDLVIATMAGSFPCMSR